MRRGTFLSLLTAIAAVPLTLGAQAPSAGPLELETPLSLQSDFTPRILKTEDRVKVVLKMSAEPVAVARSLATNKTLSRAATAAVEAETHAQHIAAGPDIAALGGTVLGHFHHAINGVKVEIPRSQLGSLYSIPGVVDVMPVRNHTLNNAVSVPFIGAPAVWSGVPGFRGEDVKIAIIDTGVDYTHANFGGPGTIEAWNTAFANSTADADPTMFGPDAPKVKGGIDLVGDDYNANFNDAAHAPKPDPNPLDCNSHGTHVSGTAAGFGVLDDGSTYQGPYNSDAYTDNTFAIGPGVAPLADLYMIRVFGCAGSTNVVVEAIEWAVEHEMDIISMSLGADFGQAHDADSEAAANAVKAGILVVAASGNSGPGLYLTSSPAAGNGVVTAAAMDSTASFPGATLQLTPGGSSITVLNSNNADFSDDTSYPVVVLRNPDGSVSLGCNESEYVDATIAGKLVVTMRGNCARVFRAGAGQKHGAAAVAMINNGPGFPPLEGAIGGGDPDTNPFDPVTIPFFGIKTSDAASLTGSTSASASNFAIPNPGFENVASFSSGGPREGDSEFKPSVAAPGVAILSSLMGTGTGGARFSGTSMATPHIAGVLALTRQAHPRWSHEDQRAAVLQTADPNLVPGNPLRLAGGGVVQPFGATRTQVVAATSDDHLNNLSFGEIEMRDDFSATREIKLRNHGRRRATFNVSWTQLSGGPVEVVPSDETITVRGRSDEEFSVTLQVPTSSVGPTHSASGALLFQEISGILTLTPANDRQNNGVTLRLPLYAVPRVRSNLVSITEGMSVGPSNPTQSLFVTNFSGAIAGTPDFFSQGLFSPRQGLQFVDPRAIGVHAIPRTASDNFLVFAVNTWTRFSNPAPDEFDICIFTKSPAGPCDVPGTKPDFVLIGIGGGFITSALPVDRMVAALFDTSTRNIIIRFFADAPTDGSTALLTIRASDLGLTSANSKLSYTAAVFNQQEGVGVPGTGTFNAFSPSLTVDPTTGPTVPVDEFTKVTVKVNPGEWAKTPAAGLMIVAPDNRAGARQAQIIPAK